jgi:hypothetical protein
MTWTESLISVKISHSNSPPILEFDLSSERLLNQHPTVSNEGGTIKVYILNREFF